jgi:hypothetical protein
MYLDMLPKLKLAMLVAIEWDTRHGLKLEETPPLGGKAVIQKCGGIDK